MAVPSDQLPEFDTVILAGGHASRMGGVDKPGLAVGGLPMLVLVARVAADAGTRQLIVVGPERHGAVGRGLSDVADRVPGGLITACEEPPGGGPVPALRCGLDRVGAPWVSLLAADLPFMSASCLAELIVHARDSGRAGAMLVDDRDRPQWLASCWHVDDLRQSLGSYEGDSLGGLLGPLAAASLRAASLTGDLPPWHDCDSPADLAAAQSACHSGGDCHGRRDGDL